VFVCGANFIIDSVFDASRLLSRLGDQLVQELDVVVNILPLGQNHFAMNFDPFLLRIQLNWLKIIFDDFVIFFMLSYCEIFGIHLAHDQRR